MAYFKTIATENKKKQHRTSNYKTKLNHVEPYETRVSEAQVENKSYDGTTIKNRKTTFRKTSRIMPPEEFQPLRIDTLKFLINQSLLKRIKHEFKNNKET